MKKYRCPICKTEFVGKLEHCPNCNTELHYIDEEVRKEAKVPQPTFHYDDFDIKNEGIEEEVVEEENNNSKKPVFVDKAENDAKVDANGNYLSYFDGNAIQKFFLKLGLNLLTIISLFIALPWTACIYYRWEAKHTVINGRRLVFDGRGVQLFGRYMLWFLLSIITFGIFIIFLSMRLLKWKTSHTHFKNL